MTECQNHWLKDVRVAMPRKALQGLSFLIRLIKPDFDIIKAVNSFASRCLIISAVILISKVTLRQLSSQVAQAQE